MTFVNDCNKLYKTKPNTQVGQAKCTGSSIKPLRELIYRKISFFYVASIIDKYLLKISLGFYEVTAPVSQKAFPQLIVYRLQRDR